MTNTNDLAAAITAHRYPHPSLDALRAEMIAECMIDSDDRLDTRDALITAISTDIRDLLHNANLDLLIDDSELDDDESDALFDSILQLLALDDSLPATIADTLLARF